MSSIGEENQKYFEGSQFKSQDVYSVVFLLLWMLKDDPKYTLLNDLIYTLDEENFIKFIQVFQGTTITVPSLEDIDFGFKCLLFYQLHDVESYTRAESLKQMGESGCSEERYKALSGGKSSIRQLLLRLSKRDKKYTPVNSGISHSKYKFVQDKKTGRILSSKEYKDENK